MDIKQLSIPISVHLQKYPESGSATGTAEDLSAVCRV